MASVTIKQLRKAGVHIGHPSNQTNAKMAQYTTGVKNNIQQINLRETIKCLKKSCAFVRKLAKEGKTILFVGSKSTAQKIIKNEANRCLMPYVNKHWTDGLLTDFDQFQSQHGSIYIFDVGETKYSSFFSQRRKEEKKSTKHTDQSKPMRSIPYMRRLPGAIFVVDPSKEHAAVTEARLLGIPVISIVDTNCDPEGIDYIIPGNDDRISAIQILTSEIADAILHGQKSLKQSDSYRNRFDPFDYLRGHKYAVYYNFSSFKHARYCANGIGLHSIKRYAKPTGFNEDEIKRILAFKSTAEEKETNNVSDTTSRQMTPLEGDADKHGD